MSRRDLLAVVEAALGLPSPSPDARLDAVGRRLMERQKRAAARQPRAWCVGCILCGPVPEAELLASGHDWFVDRWLGIGADLADGCADAKLAGRPGDSCVGGKTLGGYFLSLARNLAANRAARDTAASIDMEENAQ